MSPSIPSQISHVLSGLRYVLVEGASWVVVRHHRKSHPKDGIHTSPTILVSRSRSVCDEDIAGLLLDLSESLYTGDLEEIVRADIDLPIAADL